MPTPANIPPESVTSLAMALRFELQFWLTMEHMTKLALGTGGNRGVMQMDSADFQRVAQDHVEMLQRVAGVEQVEIADLTSLDVRQVSRRPGPVSGGN